MEEQQINTIADELKKSFVEATGDTETPEAEDPVEDSALLESADAEEADEVETVEAKEDNEGVEPDEVFQAPEHWSSDLREQFSSLTPEAQQILINRDKEFQKGYQEKAQSISAIQQAIEPWKQALAQRGVTPEQAIRSLFAAQHMIESDPLNGILQLARNMGVVDQLKNQFAPDTDEDFSDPEVRALKQEIKELRAQIDNTGKTISNQQTQGAQETLNAFVNAVDESGNKKHPYFEQVKHLMAPLVGSGKTLEDAYSQVVWSVPEYRESAIKKEPSDVEKAQKVRQAKRASRSIKPNGKAKQTESEESLSISDDLRLAWKQHSN